MGQSLKVQHITQVLNNHKKKIQKQKPNQALKLKRKKKLNKEYER